MILTLMGMLSNQAIAQISCFGDLNLSLDPLGVAEFTVDMAEEGNASGYESKWVVPTEFTCEDLSEVQDYTLYGQYANGDIDSCMGTVSLSDFVPPVAIVEIDVMIDLDDDGTLTLLPSMIDEGSYDNCSPITYDITPSSIDCESPNPVVAVLTVTDEYGNSNQAWTNIYWNEVDYSEEVACKEFNNLNVINGPITLSLSDVLLSGSSSCISDYSFVVEYEGIVEPDVTFDNSDIGKTYDVIVLDWLTGVDCSFSFTVVSGNVPYGLCAQDYSGKGIINVEMSAGAFTDDSGCITVSDNSGTFITPSKEGTPEEGIDIIDYTMIRSKILGASSMNADQMLAADLSGTPGTVSTLDLVFLDKMMAGDYVPQKVWIFRDASEDFPDNQVPVGYSESIELGSQENYMFRAIKLGDVDLSFDEVISEDEMSTLIAEDIVLNQGQSYSVPMRLESNQSLIAVNMFVKSETDDFIVTNVISDLPEYTFDPSTDIVNGVLHLNWQADDETIVDGGFNLLADESVFTLEILAKSNSVLNQSFNISSDRYSKILAPDANKGIALDLDIQDLITVPVFDTEKYEKLVISPNPSSEFINVSTSGKIAVDGTYSIINSIGQVAQTSDFTGEKIDVSNLAPGLYTFVLTTKETYFQQMLLKN